MVQRVTGRTTLYVLLILSALPDAMVPPMLRDLFVVRYGVTEGAAHWFMAVNLLGAACIVPVLSRLRKVVPPAMILAVAAALNGLLLAMLAFPIGFAGSLALRVVEGAADLVVFAVLFDLIVKAGEPSTRGRRLGLASGLLMFSIGIGLALGGVIGGGEPLLVFLAGAVASIIVAVSACTSRGSLHWDKHFGQSKTSTSSTPVAWRSLWPTMGMALADRAVGGLFIATIPLFFAAELQLTTIETGGLLGITMAVMAIGSWPAGFISDRLGHLRVRIITAMLYAASVVGVAAAPQLTPVMLVIVMAAVGLAGAALMPTSLALATRSGEGAVAMGSLHAAGNVGFFIGIVGSGILIQILRPQSLSASAFVIVIIAMASLHVVITIVTTTVMLVQRRLSTVTVAHSLTNTEAI